MEYRYLLTDHVFTRNPLVSFGKGDKRMGPYVKRYHSKHWTRWKWIPELKTPDRLPL